MRTVFLFPLGDRADTVARLDRYSEGGNGMWTFAEHLYAEIDDEATGCLFRDWEPDDVDLLESALGYHPTWAVQVDISGRIDGTAEVRQLAALMLGHGGVAFDDYSEHPWSLVEIEAGTAVDGLGFFDFRAYHERHHGPWT